MGSRRVFWSVAFTLIGAAVAGESAAQIAVDGSTPTTLTTNGARTVVDGGVVAGANQFHSFTDFNIATGATVDFQHSGPGAINNVVSRVTGASPSVVDGTLRVSMPDANFFLINPNGVILGANAAFDVPGATSLTDAQRLNFADGTSFDADLAIDSSFSVSTPTSFGFLGQAEPGGLFLDGTTSSTLVISNQSALVFDGESAGANQFHSFGSFSVSVLEPLAFFSLDPVPVENIIVRDTGGAPSRISGRLGFFNPDVTLFVMNDDGVEIYEGADIDPPGGLFVTAGSDLGFADGASFASDLARPSDFSAAAPVEFGFIDGIGGDIRLLDPNGAASSISPGRAAFAGRNIEIGEGVTLGGLVFPQEGDPLALEEGEIAYGLSFFAVGGGENTLDPFSGEAGAPLEGRFAMTRAEFNSFVPAGLEFLLGGVRLRAEAGDIEVSDSLLGNGRILSLIATNQLSIEETTLTNVGDAAQSFLISGDLLNVASSEILGSGGVIQNPSASISAQRLIVSQSTLSTFSTTDASGGVLFLSVADEAIFEDSFLLAGTLGNGIGGSIQLVGDAENSAPGDLNVVFTGTDVSADAISELGAPGLINITANSVAATDSSFSADALSGAAVPGSSGILVQANDLEFLRTEITTDSLGGASGASMFFVIEEAALIQESSFASSAGVTGEEGAIVITGAGLGTDNAFGPGELELTIANSTLSSTDSFSIGASGNVSLRARSIDLSDTLIEAVTIGENNGGGIVIEASETAHLQNSNVTAATSGSGTAGIVAIVGRAVTVGDNFAQPGALALTLDGATISTATSAEGASRQTFIAAQSLTANDSTLSAVTSGDGDGGDIFVEISQEATLNNTNIEASSTGGGDSGAIIIAGVDPGGLREEGDLDFAIMGGQISTSTAAGGGQASVLAIYARSVDISGAQISSETTGSGNASDILLQGDVLNVTSGANVSSTTSGGGDAGFLQLRSADALLVAGEGTQIQANSLASGGGIPGLIFVDATNGMATITDGAVISTNNNRGVDDRVLLLSLDVRANDLTISNGASVTALGGSAPGSRAGNVTLQGQNFRLLSGASVTTNALNGEAGSIRIEANDGSVLEVSDASITTTSESGVTSGGEITFEPINGDAIGAIVLSNATLEALGGGNTALLVVNADSLVADTASTIAIAGTIDAPDTEITNTVRAVDVDFLNASDVLRNQCAQRRSGDVSTLAYADAIGVRTNAAVGLEQAIRPELYLVGARDDPNGQPRLALLCGGLKG